MAAPSVPTVTTICTEALKRAIHSTPSAAQLTRAADWMEEVKNDIYLASKGKGLRCLYTTTYSVTVEGKHRYSCPTDYAGDLSIAILDGEHTGTATAGAAGSITLASDEDVTEDYILGKYILVTSGTGANSCSQVTAYNTSTKVATVSPDFATAPAASSGYMIIDEEIPLDPTSIRNIDRIITDRNDRPTKYALIGDDDNHEFVLDPVPDDVYGIRIRYYTDLMELDLTSTRISTLYQKARNLWIQGVYARALQDKDEKRSDTEMLRYYQMLGQFIDKEFDDSSDNDTLAPAY